MQEIKLTEEALAELRDRDRGVDVAIRKAEQARAKAAATAKDLSEAKRRAETLAARVAAGDAAPAELEAAITRKAAAEALLPSCDALVTEADATAQAEIRRALRAVGTEIREEREHLQSLLDELESRLRDVDEADAALGLRERLFRSVETPTAPILGNTGSLNWPVNPERLRGDGRSPVVVGR